MSDSPQLMSHVAIPTGKNKRKSRASCQLHILVDKIGYSVFISTATNRRYSILILSSDSPRPVGPR